MDEVLLGLYVCVYISFLRFRHILNIFFGFEEGILGFMIEINHFVSVAFVRK